MESYLRYRQVGEEQKKALRKVANQFETVFLQLALKSMRDANKVMASGLLNNSQSEMYQDMYDKQITMDMSRKGVGLADMIVQQLSEQKPLPASQASQFTMPSRPQVEASGIEKSPEKFADLPSPFGAMSIDKLKVMFSGSQPVAPSLAELSKNLTAPKPILASSATDKTPVDEIRNAQQVSEIPKGAQDHKTYFVQTMWKYAQRAATILGGDPRVILAQAALETNWGRQVAKHSNGDSSNNLFGIKADSRWLKDKVIAGTFEVRDGVARKEKASFRSYQSAGESFTDYVDFLKSNKRYRGALQQAADPKAFAHALQKAGYATDPNYANKILNIMRNLPWKQMLGGG